VTVNATEPPEWNTEQVEPGQWRGVVESGRDSFCADQLLCMLNLKTAFALGQGALCLSIKLGTSWSALLGTCSVSFIENLGFDGLNDFVTVTNSLHAPSRLIGRGADIRRLTPIPFTTMPFMMSGISVLPLSGVFAHEADPFGGGSSTDNWLPVAYPIPIHSRSHRNNTTDGWRDIGAT
jgi:hypothetical protein